MDCGRVGDVGEQPQGKVLFDHQARTEAARNRNRELGAHFWRDWPRAPAGRREMIMSSRPEWSLRAFAAVSIATLALGIGAATAIFSVIDNVLLEPFPYPNANRIVFPRIKGAQQSEEAGRQRYTANEVFEIAESNHVFDGTSAAEDNL